MKCPDARGDRERAAAPPTDDSTHLPGADQMLDQATALPAKGLAGTEGQLINPVGVKLVARRDLLCGVARVAHRAGPRVIQQLVRVAVKITQRLTKGVVALKREPLSETPPDFNLQRVVGREAVIHHASGTRHEWIGLEEIDRQASGQYGAPEAPAADASGLASAGHGGLTLSEAVGKFARRVKVERVEEIGAVAQPRRLTADQGVHQRIRPAASEAQRIEAVARPTHAVAGKILLGQEEGVEEGRARHGVTRKDIDLIEIRDATQAPSAIAHVAQLDRQIRDHLALHPERPLLIVRRPEVFDVSAEVLRGVIEDGTGGG